MTIILDAMGSDAYPDPEIEGAVRAALHFQEEIILVGNEEALKSKLAAANPSHAPVRIVHARDVLAMTDKPVEGTRSKPQNSMAVGLNLLKNGEGSAFVSAGNTGGVYFNAMRALGRIKGVQRPALFPILPTKTGRVVLVDSGANSDCRPEFLVEFAIMASIYSQNALKVTNPRIGLLSNGEEEGKGNELVKAAHPLLAASKLNFVGNVEPKEVYQGEVDVVVTDGFTGNVFIKSSEAVAKLILDTLRSELKSNPIWALGGQLARPAFGKIRAMLSPDDVGAAILLGVNGLVFVGHGHSNSKAIFSAIRFAREVASLNLLGTIQNAIQTAFLETSPENNAQ
jgi:phosphate acyltransferase